MFDIEETSLKPALKTACHAGKAAKARCIIFVVILSFCVFPAGHAQADAGHFGMYAPLKIADAVPARPGAFAWSPDGRRLAFITDSINIYDTAGGISRIPGIKAPVFLSWAEDNRLLIIYREAGENYLCSLDLTNNAIKKIDLKQEADAVYQSADKSKLFLLSYKTRELKIGLELDSALFIFDLAKGSQKQIYSFGKIYPRKSFDKGTLGSWTHGGLNPLDGSLLMMEHIKPPVVAPYSKVAALDPATGKMRYISDDIIRTKYISGSWSPEGRRVALSTGDRQLEIRDPGMKYTEGDRSVRGLYPSWNPQGSEIYFGGYIMGPDGNIRGELISDGADSLAVWSPDGTALAVVVRDELRLFKGFKPVFTAPDKPLDKTLPEKISLLRELEREHLITTEEYEERVLKLVEGRGGKP